MKKTAIIGIAAVCALGAAAVYAGLGEPELESASVSQGEASKNVEVAALTTPTAAPEPAASPRVNVAASTDLLSVDAGATTESGGFTGDAPIGDENAPVTVIEYASLTCGHCAAFHEDTYGAIKEKYVDTGKVRFIMRDYPLDNFAIAAAMVARCGGQDKYLGFIDLFLEKQAVWTRAEDALGALKDLARLGGLSSARIDACLDDIPLGQSILDRARAAQDQFGISSTPSFIIDGELASGAMNLKQFSDKIDDALGE